jgi:two-component system NarL family response regulator
MGNLILASSYQDRLTSWKEGLRDFVSTSLIIDRLIIDRLDKLRDDVVRIKPEVLLLDFDLLGLSAANGSASLRRLCSEAKTIVMTGDISENVEWELVKAGVRGCCRYDIQPKFLKQAVMAVQQGELWIRRSLACRLIDELGKTTSKNKAYRATLGLLNKLTQREYDIAVRVGNGENNKQIAQACGITERTVKAHLTEIFQKLEISDRVNLALVLSSDYVGGITDLDISLNSRLEHPPPLDKPQGNGSNS